MATRVKTPGAREIVVRKQRHGGWIAEHEDAVDGSLDLSRRLAPCYRVRGWGRTADGAIRDFQSQFRICAARRSTGRKTRRSSGRKRRS